MSSSAPCSVAERPIGPRPWRRAFSIMLPSACSTRSRSTRSARPFGGDRDRPLLRGAALLEAVAEAGEQLVGADLRQTHREPALLGTGHDQQVIGEAGQPIGLLGRGADRPLELLRAAGASHRQLQLGLEDRQRGAKLMARVGDEGALALERALQAGEHLVERLPEALDLVPAPRDRRRRPGSEADISAACRRIASTGRSALEATRNRPARRAAARPAHRSAAASEGSRASRCDRRARRRRRSHGDPGGRPRPARP